MSVNSGMEPVLVQNVKETDDLDCDIRPESDGSDEPCDGVGRLDDDSGSDSHDDMNNQAVTEDVLADETLLASSTGCRKQTKKRTWSAAESNGRDAPSVGRRLDDGSGSHEDMDNQSDAVTGDVMMSEESLPTSKHRA